MAYSRKNTDALRVLSELFKNKKELCKLFSKFNIALVPIVHQLCDQLLAVLTKNS